MTRLSWMSEKYDYRWLGKVYPFMETSIDQDTEHDKIASMVRVLSRYSENVADATGNMGKRTRRQEKIGSLKHMVRAFQGLLLQTFDEH